MSVRNDRREAAIERMADHVLSQGLGAATLRPLAAAAGTSDRMLLYYFADKDELLAATLDRIAARMTAELDRAIPVEPRQPFAVLLPRVWAAMGSDSLRPFMPLWLDLAGGAARGQQPHRDIAGEIADGFLAWVAARLLPEGDSDIDSLASLFLVSIEGMYLLTAIGRGAIADTALPHLAPPPSGPVEVREVTREDAADLAELLNAIIAQGGTTALEDPFTPEHLAEAYLVGPSVHCCFVAIDRASGRLEGFQTLGRYPGLPDDVGDIGTFARIDGKQRGVGSALFAATRERARQLGLTTINATIRADNTGGLAFYGKMGFEDHSITPAAPLKDGRRVDRVNKRFRLAS